jgi:zinc transport system substrate-binding protein
VCKAGVCRNYFVNSHQENSQGKGLSMMNAKKIILLFMIVFFLAVSCKEADRVSGENARLKVIATIFPLYDFARNVGGDKITVTMLLPPGSDIHHYELKPDDVMRIGETDIFLFTSFKMEHWARKVIDAIAGQTNMLAVETGQGCSFLSIQEPHDHSGNQPGLIGKPVHQEVKKDPHIWLDFDNAQKMIENISKAFVRKDPKNREFYENNAREYKLRLAGLDKKYREQLSNCRTRTILHAGHRAFAYPASRYRLEYVAAYNVSADAEPSPQQILALIEKIKGQKLSYIYYEDLAAPRLAATIAFETGAGLLMLSNGQDISKKDIQNGISFISLMERNLENLKKGMQCP